MGQLASRGHELTPEPSEADVLVVNTCSFIDPAKQESIDTILEMAEYKKTGRARRLVVAGCLVEDSSRGYVKQGFGGVAEMHYDINDRDTFVTTLTNFLPLHLDAGRAAHRALRTSVLGSVIGRPDLAAAIAEADRHFTSALREVLGEAQSRGWIRPDVEVGALGLWWVSVVDGRFHMEYFDTGVNPADWDFIALEAARHLLFGS